MPAVGLAAPSPPTQPPPTTTRRSLSPHPPQSLTPPLTMLTTSFILAPCPTHPCINVQPLGVRPNERSSGDTARRTTNAPITHVSASAHIPGNIWLDGLPPALPSSHIPGSTWPSPWRPGVRQQPQTVPCHLEGSQEGATPSLREGRGTQSMAMHGCLSLGLLHPHLQ